MLYPEHWYQYEFPLPVVPGAPVPSQADYSQENVAPLIEFFAQMLVGYNKDDLKLWYENNTPNDRTDDIFVTHPGGTYLPVPEQCSGKSPEMKKYEKYAKKSKILKKFEKYSPAGITYFQPDPNCLL